jgi:hypothetical protein
MSDVNVMANAILTSITQTFQPASEVAKTTAEHRRANSRISYTLVGAIGQRESAGVDNPRVVLPSPQAWMSPKSAAETVVAINNQSNFDKLVKTWLNVSDAVSAAGLHEFPNAEFGLWREKDAVDAISAKRFFMFALHSIGFSYFAHASIDPFHFPDETTPRQFPDPSFAADLVGHGGCWLWIGEPILGVGEAPSTGEAPTSFSLPDPIVINLMKDNDNLLTNGRHMASDWLALSVDDSHDNMSFRNILDKLKDRVKERSKHTTSRWRKYDSIGIVSTLRGFIEQDASGHPVFVDDLHERRAALRLPCSFGPIFQLACSLSLAVLPIINSLKNGTMLRHISALYSLPLGSPPYLLSR